MTAAHKKKKHLPFFFLSTEEIKAKKEKKKKKLQLFLAVQNSQSMQSIVGKLQYASARADEKAALLLG